MLRLSELLGRPVTTGEEPLGRVDDLAVGREHGHPAVDALAVRERRSHPPTWLAWGPEAVTTAAGVHLADAVPVPEPSEAGRLQLRRHVLDSQVIDVEGKRLLRVGDVVLAESDTDLRLIGVEIGAAPLLRRLGLGRLARRGGEELLDWVGLHLASAPGHVLQLGMPQARIHRLDETELRHLLERLPPARAAELAGAGGFEHLHAPPSAPARERRGPRFGRVLRARRRAPL